MVDVVLLEGANERRYQHRERSANLGSQVLVPA